jgi:hyperosmotically inducible protein
MDKPNRFTEFFQDISLILFFPLLFLTACSMVSGRETPGQYIDDAAITTRIKAQLAGDPSVKPMQVNVETFQGTVQLSGFVDSQKTATRAVEIAHTIPGVISVKDSLVVP